MRTVAALLLLLSVCTGAKAESREPFGVPFYTHSDNWAYGWQMKFLGEYKPVISAIADQVKQKPKANWIAWINQKVNLSPELVGLSSEAVCGRLAVAKFEVLLQLGFPKEDLRLVYGNSKTKGEHAVAAVRTPEGWRVLDNGHLVADYSTPLDSQIKNFNPERSFY